MNSINALDAFNYLSVLLSIILGLAITQVLKGYRGMLLTRASVNFYWPTLVWSFSLLLIFTQSWWSMFGMRHMRHWTFATFGVVVLQTIVSYMMAALVFPDFFGEKRVDLREHYYAHARWFYGLTIALLFVSLGKEEILEGRLPDTADVVFHCAFILGSLGAAMTRNRIYHEVVNAAMAILIVAYVFVLFSELT